MAIGGLGAIGKGAQAAKGIFGGGGPRAPRMSSCQKQMMQQHANAHMGLNNHMRMGCQRVCSCGQSMFGNPFNQQFGPIASRGINGSFAFAGSSGFGGAFNSLSNPLGFSPFGGGLPLPPLPNVSFSMGISMNV